MTGQEALVWAAQAARESAGETAREAAGRLDPRDPAAVQGAATTLAELRRTLTYLPLAPLAALAAAKR